MPSLLNTFKATSKPFARLIVIVVITLGLFEAVVRVTVETSGPGLSTIQLPWIGIGLRLPPYPDPSTKVQEFLKRTSTSEKSRVIYDSYLGYTYRPSYADTGTKQIHNGKSIRVDDIAKEFSSYPASHTLRIAIFGDSFSHADEVAYADSWGNQLEIKLNSLGINTEVLNFGVGGYGMDQAYLRYLHQGIEFNPDIVIFGFQIENALRNLYLFRYFYKQGRSGILWSKPRFVFENGELILVNQPTPRLDELADIFNDFPNWMYSQFERFHHADDYGDPLWHHLTFVKLLIEVYRRYKISLLSDAPNGEAYVLALRIIEAFAQSANQNNSKFVILHLPPGNHLSRYPETGQFQYEELLSHLESNYMVVRPEKRMIDGVSNGKTDMLFGGAHYSEYGNRIVGTVVAEFIATHPDLNTP